MFQELKDPQLHLLLVVKEVAFKGWILFGDLCNEGQTVKYELRVSAAQLLKH